MTTGDQPDPGSSPITNGDDLSHFTLPKVATRVFRRLPVGVVVFDHGFRVVLRNRVAESLLSDEPLVTEALRTATVESSYEDWAASLGQVLQAGKSARFESITCRGPSGQDLLVSMTCVPLDDETNSRVVGGLLVLEDVTQQATMERRLAVSERLAAVGKLAARVAHELNNPLDGILRYINMAIRATEEDSDKRVGRYLSESRKGLMRMAQIIRELLEFSRTSHGALEQTNINQLVEDAVKALANEATVADVTIVMSLGSQVPAVGAGNLFQVFCNLIKNAIDAMPDGGTLTISTKQLDQYVMIRFEDTGIGLPDDADQIFEPFFTTKEPGKGTGLGLAVCRDIVERYNGQLTAENRPNGGAAFETRIPLSSCAASADRASQPGQGDYQGERTDPPARRG